MSGTTNTFLNSSELDFATQKQSLINFLSSNSVFKGFNFAGTNLSAILDVLTINTLRNAFYLNQTGSELFLNSADLPDSINMRAKELNYLPRSYKSAETVVNVTVNVTDNNIPTVVVPAGFTITGTANNYNYRFQTLQPTILYANSFSANITFYEGLPVTEVYNVQQSNIYQTFIISNPNIDIDTLIVNVQNSNTDTTNTNYTFANSLLSLNSTSTVYYLQPTYNQRYEIQFGDGVFGQPVQPGNIIKITYLVSSAGIPNGISTFSASSNLGNNYNVTLTTISSASGGTTNEDKESVRYTAPKAYQAQGRATTEDDYSTLLTSMGYDSIVYGGEKAPVPQFGKIYISINNYDTNTGVVPLTDSEKIKIADSIQKKMGMQLSPVIIDPLYTWIQLTTTVNYNVNVTTNTPNTIFNNIITALNSFNTTSLKNFKSPFWFSKLLTTIDNSDSSIVGNMTTIKLMQSQDATDNTPLVLNYTFSTPVDQFNNADKMFYPSIKSSSFILNGINCILKDDGNGNLNAYSSNNSIVQSSLGTVNYSKGEVNVLNLNAQSLNGALVMYVTPAQSNFIPTTNMKLYVDVANSIINVQGVSI